MIQDKVYFNNLNAIRFIAAMMVFVAHAFGKAFACLQIPDSIISHLFYTIGDGRAAVSMFFVLSGFLITYLLIREYQLNGIISLKNFYVRRILRIFPLYYLVVIFSCCLYPLILWLSGSHDTSHANVLYHFIFLSNFDAIIMDARGFTDEMSRTITWSVSIEEQFYVFWPLIFAFLPKRTWVYSILALIIAAVIFRLINTDHSIVLYFHTWSGLLDLAIGGIMAFSVLNFPQVRNYFESRSTLSHVFFFGLSFCLLYWRNVIFSFEYGAALGQPIISVLFAIIICSQALTKSKSVLDLGNWKMASRLGKYTYGIYLLHPIALTICGAAVSVFTIPNGFLSLTITGISAYFLTIALSKLSYYYFESYFLRIKDRFTTVRSRNV